MTSSPSPVWIFDLDDTLHYASAHIFPHINRAMTGYVMEHVGVSEAEANKLRQDYWKRYGATLLGLVRHHGTDPHHFLQCTHQFPDLDRMLVYDRGVRAVLRDLPGRKIVLSNSPLHYAQLVLEAMGIRRYFEAVYCIERLRFRPKPQLQAFRTLLKERRLAAQRCIMVEDNLENLYAAKRLGMRTVWVSRDVRSPAHVDLRLKSLLELPRKLARL